MRQQHRATNQTVSDRSRERVQVSTAELIALRHSAQTLNLHAGSIRSLQGQNYLSPFKGRGMEFDESRPYQAGDDIRSLDWRVTARTGKAHTKLFREERERPVILAVDYRPAMFFATQGSFKSVLAAKSAALLAWRASQQGDRLGSFIFSAGEHWEARPTLRARATLHLLEQLSTRGRFQAKQALQEAEPDSFAKAAARLRRVVRPGSLVALISDFRGMDANAAAHLAQLARHNQLMMIFIHDRLEAELPPAGEYRVARRDRDITLDTRSKALRAQYAQHFEQRRQSVEQLCWRHRMIFVPLATHQDPLQGLQNGLLLQAP